MKQATRILRFRFECSIDPDTEVTTFVASCDPLCWLAFLITGDWRIGVEAVALAICSEKAESFLSASWATYGVRRLVAVTSLAAIGPELQRSAQRVADALIPDLTDIVDSPAPARGPHWGLTKADLSRALLAIDTFPRCALLLTLFEELRIEDTALILNADKALVRKACALATIELTQNILSVRWRGSTWSSRN